MIFPKDMQVVVLMGGLGTRLQECAVNVPKSMVEVQGFPFFNYQLNLMVQAGFKKFLFLVGHKAEMIEEYYGNGEKFYANIQYSYDGETLKGTGGAICNAFAHLEKYFMIIYGDSFMDIDYTECLYRFSGGLRKGKDSLMVIYHNNNKLDKSNVCVADNEIIVYDKYNTSSDMSYVDYGVSVCSKEIFEEYLQRDKLDLAEVQNKLSIQGRMSAHIVTKRFYEVGTQESLAEFVQYAYDRFQVARPAVFLDRDGVINEIVYNEDTEQLDSPLSVKEFQLLPEVEKAIRKLNEVGYYVFIVTNQPAAAKGKVKLEKLYDINRHCIIQLENKKAYVEDVFMCPHYGLKMKKSKEVFLIQKCNCRKPKSGLLQLAAEKYRINMKNSFMIGDSYTDILAGRRFGIKTILLGNLKCDICRRLQYEKPDYICVDLIDAVETIVNKS